MKIYLRGATIFLFIIALSSCDRADTSPKTVIPSNDGAVEAVVSDKDPRQMKVGEVISVEKYYLRIKNTYLLLAQAKNPEEMAEAFDVQIRIHTYQDLANYKCSCVFFYQGDELYHGIADNFSDPKKAWVRGMAEDLVLILDNILKFSGENEKCALVAKVFAAGLGAGSLDDFPDVIPSVVFLRDFRNKLSNALR